MGELGAIVIYQAKKPLYAGSKERLELSRTIMRRICLEV